MSRNFVTLCPECGSDEVECLSSTYYLFRCLDCNERFSQEDSMASKDRSSQHRTKPRKYDDD